MQNGTIVWFLNLIEMMNMTSEILNNYNKKLDCTKPGTNAHDNLAYCDEHYQLVVKS